MKLTSLTKLAVVSAVALGVALYGGASDAANEIGASIPIALDGTVENDLTMTVNDGVLFFSAVGDAVDTATGVIAPDGTPTHDTGTGYGLGSAEPASLVWDDANAGFVVPNIVITDNGSFDDTLTLFVGIDPDTLPVDLTCGPVAGAVRVAALTTDQATPMTFTMPEGGPAAGTIGSDALVGGAITINFGVSLETATGLALGDIVSGACTTGAFNVVLSY